MSHKSSGRSLVTGDEAAAWGSSETRTGEMKKQVTSRQMRTRAKRRRRRLYEPTHTPGRWKGIYGNRDKMLLHEWKVWAYRWGNETKCIFISCGVNRTWRGVEVTNWNEKEMLIASRWQYRYNNYTNLRYGHRSVEMRTSLDSFLMVLTGQEEEIESTNWNGKEC